MYKSHIQRKSILNVKNENAEVDIVDLKRIGPDDQEKKDKLDKILREEVKREFFNVLKKTDITEEEKVQISSFMHNYIKKNQYFFVSYEDQKLFVNGIIDDFFGLSIIESLLHDPSVQEIWVIGEAGIFYESNGKRHQHPNKFKNDTAIRSVINKILAQINRKVDEMNPTCQGRLKNGSRISVTIPPVALKGSELNIRKFKESMFGLDKYVEYGSCSMEMRKFLKLCVEAKFNILVSGGTGSGKTTLLNALTLEIPSENSLEHIITIEDAAELKVHQTMVSSWETKNKNAEGVGGVDATDLVAHSLRNAPDRIILGEIRDKVAFEVLQAANTGHDGTMSTIHANNSKLAVKRFGDLAAEFGILESEEAQQSLVDTFDLILSIRRIEGEKPGDPPSRKIAQITWCAGWGKIGASKLRIADKDAQENRAYLQDLFTYDYPSRQFVCPGFIPNELIQKAARLNVIISPELFKKTIIKNEINKKPTKKRG